MKVIGIKGNYTDGSNDMPEVFLMADSSLLKDGKPLFLPDFATEFIAHPTLVVRINRLGKNISRRFAPRYYDAVTVGLCIEAKHSTDKRIFKEEGAVTNAFDGSAILGEFMPVETFLNSEHATFSVQVNDTTPIITRIADMSNDIDALIEELSKYFTFKIGDFLFTGYRCDTSFPLSINDIINGSLGDTQLLHFKVK